MDLVEALCQVGRLVVENSAMMSFSGTWGLSRTTHRHAAVLHA